MYVKLYKDFNQILDDLILYEEMLSEAKDEKKLKDEALENINNLQDMLEELQEEITEEILPKNPVDSKNCTLEIR